MNFEKRITTLRDLMEKNNLDGIFTTVDATMEYLTGIPRINYGKTKQRQNGTEYACVLVTFDKVMVFLPSLNYIVTMAKLGERKTLAEIIPYEAGDHEADALMAIVDSLKLSGKLFGVTEDITAPLALKLIDKGLRLCNANDLIIDMRSVKDEDELCIMREAIAITDSAYRELISKLSVGASTSEMEKEFEKILFAKGASMLSFDCELNTHGPKAGPMVGFSQEILEKGCVLGLDFGIVYKGYCTDLGRTAFIGEPTKEHQSIFAAIRSSLESAMEDMARQGATGDSADTAARKVLTDRGYGDRFIHKLGHGIGKDVHERPILAKGEHRILKPSMVFAVEPSVFTPRNSFIRLEEMVLIGNGKVEKMSSLSWDYDVI